MAVISAHGKLAAVCINVAALDQVFRYLKAVAVKVKAAVLAEASELCAVLYAEDAALFDNDIRICIIRCRKCAEAAVTGICKGNNLCFSACEKYPVILGCIEAAAAAALLKITSKLQCSGAELVVGTGVYAENIEISADLHIICRFFHYQYAV